MKIKIENCIKLPLIGLLLVGIYYSAYRLMINWWERDDFNYCYFIPPLVAYLIWEKRRHLQSFPSETSWWGMLLFIPGIFLFWLGELGGEYYTLYVSSWLVMVGLVWMHTGWRKLRVIRFPLFMILTMFPFPDFINNNLALKLKLVSSQLGTWMLRSIGRSAYREGNVIDIGFTQLQVVDACSGLRYLFPLVLSSLLIVYFSKASLWKKVIVVLSSVPASILVNGLRIASVGLLYPVWGEQVVDGFFHDFSGWFMFMISVGILGLELWLLGKIGSRTPKPDDQLSEKRWSENITVAEKSSGLFRPQFVAAVLLLGMTLGLAHGIEFREKIPAAKSFDQFPMTIAEWSGQRGVMEQDILDELDLSDFVIANYRNPAGEYVNFYVAFYETQRKGESIHSPETCLPANGWAFNRSGTTTFALENNTPSEMTVNRAFMEKGDARQLSYFWFPMRGRILTNIYQMKFFNFWDALTRQRTDGALVRLITPVGETESVADADRRLKEFIRVVNPVLERFLPSSDPQITVDEAKDGKQ